MNKVINLAKILFVVSSIYSIYCCINILNGDFLLISLLPISFLVTYPFLLHIINIRQEYRITAFLILVLSYIRLVIHPIIGSLNKFYEINNFMNIYSSLPTSVALIIYEQIAICVILYFICLKKTRLKKYNISLRGYRQIYKLYILIAIGVYLIWGRSLGLFEFAVKTIGTIERSGDIVNSSLLVIREISSSGLVLLFFIFIESMRKKYAIHNKNIYINLSILSALLLASVIIGERRSNQIYVGFASCWTLIKMYPFYSKKIINSISIVVLGIIGMMSVYKYFNAFLYDSYLEAFQNTDSNIIDSLNTFDASSNGIKTIMMNVEFAKLDLLNLKVFLYDIFRNIFGIHTLFKGSMLTTLELYNKSIYSGDQLTGYLFSSIGYGYAYLGFIFAPIITAFNIYIASFLEKTLNNCKSIEMNYILSIIFIRTALGVLSSPAPLINNGSRILFIYGFIFISAKYFLKK